MLARILIGGTRRSCNGRAKWVFAEEAVLAWSNVDLKNSQAGGWMLAC
jgi:hypothetical protein